MKRGFDRRRGRLGLVALFSCLLALAGAAAPAAAAEGAGTQPYTAWQGYATTAQEGSVPGAVPVAAPASGEELWRTGGEAAGALAVRQIGSSSVVYALEAASVVRLDASTGEQTANAELHGKAPASSQVVFADSALAVPLASGRVALYDEDLNQIRVSKAPGSPEGGAYDAAALATSGNTVFAAWYDAPATAGAPARVTVAAYSTFDDGIVWETSYESPDATAELSLFYTDSALVLADGSAALRQYDWGSGELVGGFDAPAPIGSRVARVPGDPSGPECFLVGSEDGSLTLVEVSAAGSRASASTKLDAAPADAAPAMACVQGSVTAFVYARDSTLRSVSITVPDASGDDAHANVGQAGSCAAAVPASRTPLAVFRGARLDETVCEVYSVAADTGALQRTSFSATDLTSGSTERVGDREAFRPSTASGASLACSPVADRDGSLTLVDGSGAVVRMAADQDAAAATDVGGSVGLDTLGATLTGVSLPNGAGLGAGVLVFAVAAGAYAYIRNRGGRSTRDQGLDEWREKEGRKRR